MSRRHPSPHAHLLAAPLSCGVELDMNSQKGCYKINSLLVSSSSFIFFSHFFKYRLLRIPFSLAQRRCIERAQNKRIALNLVWIISAATMDQPLSEPPGSGITPQHGKSTRICRLNLPLLNLAVDQNPSITAQIRAMQMTTIAARL